MIQGICEEIVEDQDDTRVRLGQLRWPNQTHKTGSYFLPLCVGVGALPICISIPPTPMA